MLEMQLAPNAFGPFYGATFSLIIGAEIYDLLAELMPEDAAVFILNSEGLIELAHPLANSAKENSGVDPAGSAKTIALSGLPVGLKAIIVDASRKSEAEALSAFCEDHQPDVLPSVLCLNFLRSGSLAKLSAALMNTLTPFGTINRCKKQTEGFLRALLEQNLHLSQQTLGTTQQQLSVLRQRYERLSLNHEKALRMMRGAGFRLRNICFSLHPSENTVGIVEDSSQHGFKQRLPIDLVGLVAIHLFVDEPPKRKVDGSLSISIRRCADQALIGETQMPYSKISKGWVVFEFAKMVSDTYGDGYLELLWQGKGGPKLALAELQADRYGDENGNTLALRLEKGLGSQSFATDNDVPLDMEPGLPPTNFSDLEPVSEAVRAAGQLASWQIRSHCMADFLKEFVFYRGAAELVKLSKELGFSPMSVNDETGALQTHPYQGKHSAAVLKGGVPIYAVQLSCEVCTAHVSAGAFTYILIVLPKHMKGAADAVDQIAEKVQAGDLVGHDPANGVQWRAKTLKAMKTGNLSLDLAAGPTEPMDVVFAAKSAEGNDSYGWCRWYSYAVTLGNTGAVRNQMDKPDCDAELAE